MYTSKLFILSLIICPAAICLAQKWTPNWQYRSKAHHVKFVNATTGYMSFTPHELIPTGGWEPKMGVYGLLLKTTNGGNNWSEQKFDSLPQLLTLDFVDANNGFMTGQARKNGTSQILKTTNGGISWTQKKMPGIRFSDMDMIDPQTIVCIGQKLTDTIASADTSIYMRSTNGGQSYSTQKLGFSAMCVQFIDASVGYMAGSSGKIHKTTNAGNTWIPVHSSTESFVKIHFINSQTGFAISLSGKIATTRNAGADWAITNLGDYDLRAIDFSNALNGYIAARGTGAEQHNGFIFRTTNAGTSWTKTLDYTQAFSDVYFATPSIGYATANHGHLIKTTNAGQTWRPLMGLETGEGTYSVYSAALHFPTNRTGYFIGTKQGVFTLTKTTNAGETWLTLLPLGLDETTSFQVSSIFFTDSLTGYVAGTGGRIFKTTDGGQYWEAQTSGTSLNLGSIFFVSPTTGYASGGRRSSANNIGIMLKTTNGGSSWAVNYTTTHLISSICFVNPQIGYAVGIFGAILRTTDAGGSWQLQTWQLQDMPIPISPDLEQVSFINPNEGYILTESNSEPVLHTTNGGQTWQTVFPIPGASHRYMAMGCGTNDCYVMGHNFDNNFSLQAFKKSTAVSNWTPETFAVSMKDISFYNRIIVTPNQTAYALSGGGIVAKKFDQLPTPNKPKPKTSRPTLTFDLFPNPSRSGTCHLQTQYWRQTKLAIIDVLGRTVQNVELTGPDTHLELGKGTYFLRLSGIQGQGMQKLVVQ